MPLHQRALQLVFRPSGHVRVFKAHPHNLSKARVLATDAPIIVDQTRKGNRPDGDFKDGHQDYASSAGRQEGGKGDAQSHPAKQPDPQRSPSKSSGVRNEGEGPEGKAGPGSARGSGGGAQKDTEAIKGAKEHSVKRPVPTEGNKAEGRGGTAL